MSKIKNIIDLEGDEVELDNSAKMTTWHDFYLNTGFEKVGEFHRAFNVPFYDELNDPIENPSVDLIRLRLKLITEELRELCESVLTVDAMDGTGETVSIGRIFDSLDAAIDNLTQSDINFNAVEAADALGDIRYVVDGAAHTFNIHLDAVVDEIHESNMSKLDPSTGKPLYREDGKILKGSNYFRPNIESIIYKKT